MHGLGNDFAVVDLLTQRAKLTPAQIAVLADRHRGIGFDQLLAVEPPRRPEADFRYRIFNTDGSEAEQCGNGARCFARFVVERGLTKKQTLVLEVPRGTITATLQDRAGSRLIWGRRALRWMPSRDAQCSPRPRPFLEWPRTPPAVLTLHPWATPMG